MQFFIKDRIHWIVTQVREIQPDVFVPNVSLAGLYAARWIRAAGIPTVGTYRSEDDFHKDIVRRFVIGESQWALSGLVCVSDHAASWIRKLNPKDTIIWTIPSGVPLDVARKTKDTNEGIKFVYAGRLVQQQKRILDVVNALLLILEELPNASAALIGKPVSQDLADEINSRINASPCADRLAVMGLVKPELVQKTLSAYDVILLLSDYEGTPGALMDGMACGLVPICIDIPGGVHELVIPDTTGLLVSDRTAGVLRAAKLLSNDKKLLERLSRNARAHIEMHFSLDAATARWESIFQDLVCKNKKVKRKNIGTPKYFRLPEVLPGHRSEDRRKKSLIARFRRRMKKMVYIRNKMYFYES